MNARFDPPSALSAPPRAVSQHPRTVHVVSGNVVVCRELERLLRALGHDVDCFASAGNFLANGMPERPHCAVLDCDLPEDCVPSLQKIAQGQDARIPVVVVAVDADVATAVRAMKAGAIDFLTLPVASDDLADAVARAALVADGWRVDEARRVRARALVERLTPRERAVFDLLLEGKLNKQIAGALDSREATVKVHRSRLVRKLEVRSLAELLELGRHLGRNPFEPERATQRIAAAAPNAGLAPSASRVVQALVRPSHSALLSP
jgi:FixJ family two-component response regulator